MFTKTFFKLFPPPKYLSIPHAGIDISDDAIHCIEYATGLHGYTIRKFGMRTLPRGTVEGGTIKDEKTLTEILKSLVTELKITHVRASLPEERMYLFKTEVPTTNEDQIRQNIEFKFEENVPLSPADAVFFFDLIPGISTGKHFVSVSVAPRELISAYLKVFESVGVTVLSFEIQAKAIAHAVVLHETGNTGVRIIVDIMDKKTGLYIVYGNVVCFTSTIPWGGESIRGKQVSDVSDEIFSLRKEIERVYTYWFDHGEGQPVEAIVMCGKDALFLSQVSHISPDPKVPTAIAHVWQNAFSTDYYIPPISHDDSLDYTVAAGLALI